MHNWVNTEPIPDLPPPKPKVQEKKTVRFDKQTTKKLPDEKTDPVKVNKEGEG